MKSLYYLFGGNGAAVGLRGRAYDTCSHSTKKYAMGSFSFPGLPVEVLIMVRREIVSS